MISSKDLGSVRSNFNLFDGLQENEIILMLNQFDKISLKQGETLLEQGSASNLLYLLIEGKLEARIKFTNGTEKVVSNILPGESVGELGALTGEALLSPSNSITLRYSRSNK